MPKGNPNAGEKKVNGILKVYDPVAKAYRPSYIAPDATATVQGDVLLSDSVTGTDDAATGITAATPKAVKEVNDNANTKLSMTATTEQTVAGPVVFGDSLTVEDESTFNEKVTFDKGISIPGGVTLEGDVTGNADTATKLKTAVNINTKSSTQTASTKVSFDGSKDITLPLGDIDASAIKGVLSLDNIPQSAIERVVNYESLDAAFDDYLAAADDNKPFQTGDTIRVPDAEGDTAEMYAIIGDPAVKNNYVKYAASIASEALEADHAKVADKINIADIADGSAMCVIDKVLKKSGATVGGEYKPMYLHNGTFEETTFTIKTNVPADAKFTDTTYTDFAPATETEEGTIERGRAGLVPAPTTKDTKFLKNDGTWADVPTNWDELDGKPSFHSGIIQDVGVEDGKFYVEALFNVIKSDEHDAKEFDAQLQILSAAGNTMKLTSSLFTPTTDGTSSHKFVIEPPTGQDIANIEIVSAGIFYNSNVLLDIWRPEQVQGKYPGASGIITTVENQEKATATGQAQVYTVSATVSGNEDQLFLIGVVVSGTEYISSPVSISEEGLSEISCAVVQPPNEGQQGDKVVKVNLYCGFNRKQYILDTWYPQAETLYLNNGKIIEVTDAVSDDTKYSVDYVINTNYDFNYYHISAKYDIPGWDTGGMSSPEYVTYNVREKAKNVMHGSVLIPKTKVQDGGQGSLELVSIKLYEQATMGGNDLTLDVWYPEKETGVSSWNDLTDKPDLSTGSFTDIPIMTDTQIEASVYVATLLNNMTSRADLVAYVTRANGTKETIRQNGQQLVGIDSYSGRIKLTGTFNQNDRLDQLQLVVHTTKNNQEYDVIVDNWYTSNIYYYFTADYDCFEMIDNLSATAGNISFKMMGWYEEFAGPNAPVKLSIKKVDDTFLTTPIEIQTIDWTPGTNETPHREVFGTTKTNEQVWLIPKADWEAQSLISAPSEYILVVATDKHGKELWAQKIDMPLTYLDPADAAQLVQDALATTTN